MVYDASTDRFATVFTHNANGYVTGVPSVIGFVKVNPALAISNPGLIWHPNGDLHNGRSISYSNMNPNGFAIGASVRDNQTFNNNPALQLVTNVGTPSGNFMRYNILDNAYFYHHTWKPAVDEYVLANEQNTDLREISTTPIGDDQCGMRKYGPKYQQYTPSPKIFRYFVRTNNKEMYYDMHWVDMPPPFRMCVPPGDSYRMAATTGISSFTADKLGLKVYPSVVSKNNAELTIENGSGVDMRVEVRNITGQLIQSTDNVGSGKTTLTLSQGLSAGVYMVHFYNENGNVGATEKILISE
jgi:hypothetical protein